MKYDWSEFKYKIHYLIYLVMFSMFYSQETQKNKIDKKLQSVTKDYIETIGFKENQIASLDSVVSTLKTENSELKEKLKNPQVVEKIKYVVKTKYETELVYVEYSDIPSEHIYFDQNNIPVCKFEYSETVKFTTFPLQYKFTNIVLEDYSYTYLNIKDYTGKIHKIELEKNKLETEVTRIKEKKFNTSIDLKLGASFSLKTTTPTISFSFLNYGNYSFLSPTLNLSTPSLGVEIASKKITAFPFIRNSYAGVSYNSFLNQPYFALNINTKL